MFPLLPGVALLPARGVVGPTAVFPPAAELRPALALPSGGDALPPACVPVVAGVFVPGGVPHAIPSAVKSIDCGEGNDTVYNTPAPMGRTNRKLLAAQSNCENVIDLAAERVLDVRALSDGSLTADLAGFEYRIYELNPRP